MKGTFESIVEYLPWIILGSLGFILILEILNVLGINLATPLCRTFCFPVMNTVSSVLKSILIGYLASPSSMCNFCG